MVLTVVDGHLHWYPHYQLDIAFDCLTRNLDNLTGETQGDRQNIFKIALLTESGPHRFFEQLRDGAVNCSSLHANITPGSDGLSLMFIQNGICRLCLINGRQIVTREQIEVLGIAMDQAVPDNLPAREVIDRIIENGGIPVLPWSPGKWFFRRGKLIKDLIDHYSSRQLVIGDTSLRPTIWPTPYLMKYAMEKGFTLIAGSDPLPMRGEEKQMGAYGFVYKGHFDPDQPTVSVREMLSGSPDSIALAGKRNSIQQVFNRLIRLRKVKRNEKRIVS